MLTEVLMKSPSTSTATISHRLRTSTKEKSVSVTELELALYNSSSLSSSTTATTTPAKKVFTYPTKTSTIGSFVGPGNCCGAGDQKWSISGSHQHQQPQSINIRKGGYLSASKPFLFKSQPAPHCNHSDLCNSTNVAAVNTANMATNTSSTNGLSPAAAAAASATTSTTLSGPISISSQGITSFWLFDRIRVDLTVDKGIRIANNRNNIVLAISSTGSSAALIHPNGRIFQYGSRVEIYAKDSTISKNSKYAKMWHKGISFTSDQCPLVYLVDSAGARTTTDIFCDLNNDFSWSVFFSDSRHGSEVVQEAHDHIKAMTTFSEFDGTKNWIVNGVRVSQTIDGLVRVSRSGNKILMKTSSTNGSASISSPFLHCTGSMGSNSHLFVRRGERRMHYDGKNFTVRNAGHSAGFDDQNQLKVY